MITTLRFQPQENFNQLRILTAGFSLLLSLLAIASDDIINADGILYVQLAKAFLEGGLAGASEVYNWPFLSIISASVSKLTSLSHLNSLFLINAIFFVILTDSLLLIANRLLATHRQAIIASILILCFYTLNEYRDFVIRDIGYWALSLAGLYQFIRFLETNQTKHLLTWQALTIIAVLFRIEGLLLLFVMPVLIVFSSYAEKKFRTTLLAYLWLLIGLLGLLIALSFQQGHFIDSFSKLDEIFRYIDFEKRLASLNHASNLIDSNIIRHVAQDNGLGMIILVSGFVAITVIEVLVGLSIGYLLLTVFSSKMQKLIPQAPRDVLLLALGIQLVILLTFSLTAFFMSTRYCLLAIMLLLLLITPKLCSYVEQCYLEKRKTSLSFLLLVLIFSVGDAFHHTSSKKYIVEAADWTATNIEEKQTVYTNSLFLDFYLIEANSKLHTTHTPTPADKNNFDYFLIDNRELRAKLKTKLSKLKLTTVKTFGAGSRTATLYQSSPH